MGNVTLRISYDDRLGLIKDVSAIFLKYGLNVEAFQLMNRMMTVEICENPTAPWGKILAEIKTVPLILSVECVDEISFDPRKKRMSAILDSVSPSGDPSDSFDEIVGDSAAMREVLTLARRVARTDSTVMLRGESGTGKELFAAAIHRASDRRGKVFVPLNCGALPENLLESELFGYRDGAFSGGKKGGRIGLFQFANGGTLFLDEITEMTPNLQVKLLRVLQEGRIRPLGSNEEIRIDARIITATNRDVEAMVAEGSFREDLYYRLNVIPLRLPPLRRRIDDIPLLAENCLAKNRAKTGSAKFLSRAAIERLLGYRWPGNVRELENVVNRALHLSREDGIDASDIVFDGDFGSAPAEVPRPALKYAADSVERELIRSALTDHGSLRAAARVLGVSHTTIANKAKKFGICVK
ncbi:MAG TPA: Fis family transcriptional regulator [Treponema sp.]|nr:Fis family transcriptional regulator [Treponema sp.]